MGKERDKARARYGETCKAASVLLPCLEFLSATLGMLASARVLLKLKVKMLGRLAIVWSSRIQDLSKMRGGNSSP